MCVHTVPVFWPAIVLEIDKRLSEEEKRSKIGIWGILKRVDEHGGDFSKKLRLAFPHQLASQLPLYEHLATSLASTSACTLNHDCTLPLAEHNHVWSIDEVQHTNAQQLFIWYLYAVH